MSTKNYAADYTEARAHLEGARLLARSLGDYKDRIAELEEEIRQSDARIKELQQQLALTISSMALDWRERVKP